MGISIFLNRFQASLPSVFISLVNSVVINVHCLAVRTRKISKTLIGIVEWASEGYELAKNVSHTVAIPIALRKHKLLGSMAFCGECFIHGISIGRDHLHFKLVINFINGFSDPELLKDHQRYSRCHAQFEALPFAARREASAPGGGILGQSKASYGTSDNQQK